MQRIVLASLAAALALSTPAIADSGAPVLAQIDSPNVKPGPPPVIRPPARLPEPLSNRPERTKARGKAPDAPDHGPAQASVRPERNAQGGRPVATEAPPPRPAVPDVSPPQANEGTAADVEPDMVIVTVAGDADPGLGPALASDHGLSIIAEARLALADRRVLRLRIPNGRPVREVVAALNSDARLAAAQPSFVYRLETGGVSGPPQYAAQKLRLAEAHAAARGENVVVALIDTGVDPTHPALIGANIHLVIGLDAPAGPGLHGTQMAGIIVARHGLIGVAPAVRLIAIEAFTSPNENAPARSHSFAVAKALDRAASEAADVVNLSFVGGADPLVSDLLDALADRGVVLVAAAGNAGPGASPAHPAAHPRVIAVTAIGPDNSLFPKANRGAYVDLAAPGVDVITPAMGGGYAIVSGTSVAAAHVSGVAALILERRPNIGPESLRALLFDTAVDLGVPGPDLEFGAGLIEPVTALSHFPKRLARPTD